MTFWQAVHAVSASTTTLEVGVLFGSNFDGPCGVAATVHVADGARPLLTQTWFHVQGDIPEQWWDPRPSCAPCRTVRPPRPGIVHRVTAGHHKVSASECLRPFHQDGTVSWHHAILPSNYRNTVSPSEPGAMRLPHNCFSP
eukprot:1137631-Pelagomonas_calceolata.AAC.3